MKNILNDYLRKLTSAGIGLNFRAALNNYEKFTMYCLLGPDENILHLTFAPDRHESAKKQLLELDESIVIRPVRPKVFCYNKVFSDYFTGRTASVTVKIDSPFISRGTQFQQRIWHHISQIPYGRCITYSKLAELAGSPGGARAAGTACGANPLAVIIPCHRVIATNGPGGFTGGVSIKESLLALERAGIEQA